MKKIRIGVIEFGRMGRGMVSVMRMDDRYEDNATGTQRILEINQLAASPYSLPKHCRRSHLLSGVISDI